MKSTRPIVVLGIMLLLSTVFIIHLVAAQSNEPKPGAAYEYATIRWAGRDNTHVVRPGGQVEVLGPELRKMLKPDRADDRAFYMNLAMNGLAKEGYEFAGMDSDDIIMRKAISH
jgi:hypothetical protein